MVRAAKNTVKSRPAGYLEKSIARHPFLAGMNPRFLRRLTECAVVERFAIGQFIFRERTPAEHFYLINRGRISLETFIPGKGVISVQTLEPGDALGWSWLFPPREWQFSARVIEPCELITFGAAGLRQRADGNKAFAHELIQRIARVLLDRLQATRRRLMEFYEPLI